MTCESGCGGGGIVGTVVVVCLLACLPGGCLLERGVAGGEKAWRPTFST